MHPASETHSLDAWKHKNRGVYRHVQLYFFYVLWSPKKSFHILLSSQLEPITAKNVPAADDVVTSAPQTQVVTYAAGMKWPGEDPTTTAASTAEDEEAGAEAMQSSNTNTGDDNSTMTVVQTEQTDEESRNHKLLLFVLLAAALVAIGTGFGCVFFCRRRIARGDKFGLFSRRSASSGSFASKQSQVVPVEVNEVAMEKTPTGPMEV